jgi:hypothetical protein
MMTFAGSGTAGNALANPFAGTDDLQDHRIIEMNQWSSPDRYPRFLAENHPPNQGGE